MPKGMPHRSCKAKLEASQGRESGGGVQFANETAVAPAAARPARAGARPFGGALIEHNRWGLSCVARSRTSGRTTSCSSARAKWRVDAAARAGATHPRASRCRGGAPHADLRGFTKFLARKRERPQGEAAPSDAMPIATLSANQAARPACADIMNACPTTQETPIARPID